MFGKTSARTAAAAFSAVAFLSLAAMPASAAPLSTAASAANKAKDVVVQEYALNDTFSCDYYALPWCVR